MFYHHQAQRHFATSALRVLLMGLLLACNALANDADIVGVYFDTSASTREYFTTQYPEIVTAYLTIVNPSNHDGIAEFVCTIEQTNYDIGTGYSSSCWIGWPGSALFLACSDPMPWSEEVVVAEIGVFVPDPTERGLFYITQGEGLGAYYRPFGGAEAIMLPPTSGSFDLPVASINVELPVHDSTATWGALKCQYK